MFNLVAGASHLGFSQFIVGSLVGMAPGLGAITLFSGTLWAAVREPTWGNASTNCLHLVLECGDEAQLAELASLATNLQQPEKKRSVISARLASHGR